MEKLEKKVMENQWVYVARKAIVPQEIDQINLRIETHGGNAGAAWFDDLKIERKGAAKTVIVQENNYYPFGLKHKGYNNVVSANANSVAEKYKFGGKEHQDELNLGWYDITARNYDPALGRWMNLDPLAEITMSYSPYTYVFNNPIYFNDPTGLIGTAWDDYYDDGKGNIVYDPNVNGPDDVPTGATYIGETYTDPNTGTYWDENGIAHNSTQALDEVVVTGTSSSSSSTRETNFTIWGIGSDTSGRSGSATHGINHNEIGMPGGGGSSSNPFIRLIKYIQDLWNHQQNVQNAVNPKPNESTMEKKVENEAKNVPEKVLVVVEQVYKSFDYKDGFGNIHYKNDSVVEKEVTIKSADKFKTLDSVRKANRYRSSIITKDYDWK